MKKLSKIVNEKLRLAEEIKLRRKGTKLPEISLRKRIDWKFVEDVVEKE